MWRSRLAKKLEKIVGRDAILNRPSGKAAAHLMCLPQTAQQISQILRTANESKATVLTKLDQQPSETPLQSTVWLDLSRMDKIAEIDIVNWCAVVQPAITIAALNQALEAHQLCVHAPLAVAEGKAIDILEYPAVTGLEVVLPNGRIAKFGGKAKDAAGYHLLGLFAHSDGTFGIVTKMFLNLRKLNVSTLEPQAGLPSHSNSDSERELLARLQDVLNPRGILNPASVSSRPRSEGH